MTGFYYPYLKRFHYCYNCFCFDINKRLISLIYNELLFLINNFLIHTDVVRREKKKLPSSTQ